MAFSGHRALALAALIALGAGPALADKIKHPTAIFAGLDKITGRIIAFEVAIDETVQFGSLQITPRACFTRPQTEAPLTDGFVEVDEIVSANEMKRIFSGWMFAASPGLHGVEHPVYDVWLTDCKGGTEVIPSPPDTTAELEPPPAASDLNKPPLPPKPGTVPRRRTEPTGEAALPGAPGAAAPQQLPGSPAGQAVPATQAPAQTRPLPSGPIEVGPPPGSRGGGGLFGFGGSSQPAQQQSAGPVPPADIPNVPAPQRRRPIQQFYPTLPDPAGPR